MLPGPLAADLSNDAGPAHPSRQLVDADGMEPLGEVVGGLVLFEAQLWRGVQLASVGDEMLAGGGVDLGHLGTCLRGH